ncbi:hypothetical protein ACFLSQ_07615 [Bacteroidota bacterium]
MKTFLIISAILLSVFLFSCSETTDSSDNPYVKVVAEMNSNVVSNAMMTVKNPDIQANDIDSIVIKDFRILLSRLKFQAKTGDNDPNDDEHEMKVGPFILQLDSTGNSFTLASGEIPEGIYSKIKFELHRFSGDELDTFKDDPVYGEFATEDRYSAIISGVIFEAELQDEFTFNATVTANLMLEFEPEIVFEEGGDYTIVLELDPDSAFIGKDGILDPRIQKDANDIENAIKSAFKALKK